MMPLPVELLADIREVCANGLARTIREASDISLRELAAYIEVSPATLSGWETGQQKPTGDRALCYLRVLLALSERRAAFDGVGLPSAVPAMLPSSRPRC
jgi:transcriptional regulator with XRE-family HTH domain